jgi:hypothetical protein
MRKSIVLMTLAALTASLAVGCASSGEAAPAGPLFPHFPSDFLVRRPLETAVLVTPSRPVAPAATVSQAPQRARAPVALSRPTRLGDR